MESLESVLEFIKSLQGYYKAPKDYPIELKTNSHGVIYSKVAFLYRGGQSYTYILLLGKHQVLISDAAWIDTDSLKTL